MSHVRDIAAPLPHPHPYPRPRRRTPIALILSVFALVVAGLTVSSPGVGSAQAPAPGADNVDVTTLDNVPRRAWGVADMDPLTTQTETLDVLVWDFEQIGDRMFVGGAFLNVQENNAAAPISQPYIAAFDVTTGDWISTWQPTLDRAVYSLESLNGMLIVGGEFEQVNGTPRTGLVALDPITGQIDPTFEGLVQRPWSDLRAVVRTLKVSGDDLYVGGNFSHAVGQWGTRTRMYKVARFNGSVGAIDTTWRPEVTGSGIWGLDVDPSRGEVHLTGFFTAVNAEADTGHFHTVDDATGATAPGKIELPRNFPASQPEMFDVTMGDDKVFVIGEQHVIQVLEPSDHTMVGYHHTGVRDDAFPVTGFFSGGAYQVGERIGDIVFAGCHCTRSERNGFINHFSSFSGQRTPHRLLMAYDANTGELIEEFMPDINAIRDGTWAIDADTNGCLWVGGDFHVGGVDSGEERWLGGFGTFCEDLTQPPNPGVDALVSAGSDWRYDDSGADLGTAWRDPGYDDAAWPVGSAEFGFGDGDEATVFATGNVAYYARHSFEFTGTNPTSLDIGIKADDGAVVYLNGVELARDNMPDGTITASTPAAGWKGGTDEQTFFQYSAPADALVQGTNVIAVSVHNQWSGNPDLSLDVTVEASDAAPPEPPEPPPVDVPLVAAGDTWNYIADATSTPAGWLAGIDNGNSGAAPLGFDEADLSTTLPAGNEAYYFTRTFEVADAAALASLTLGLRADDGAVVYLNGTEVQRFNMPDGAIDWSTRPVDALWGAAEAMTDYTIDGAALVDGTNVIAVEVHNFWPGNPDLVFDLRLE